MLRRRDAQHSYFDAQSVPHRVAEDSFYGRMGAVSDRLFKDDDLAEMYCPDNGRPSIPPSLMCGVLLLQFYDDVSDREAVERMLYDMRWKVALNLPLDFAGIDPSTLVVFRKRLVRHDRERYAFDRLIEVGRAAGFIPEKVTLLIDTTSAKGAGAVQDSYTLLRKGIRKLLKTAGFHVAGKRRNLSARAQALVSSYLDQDRKADIDWSDAEQRSAQLKVLVQDAEAALALTAEQMDDEEVRSVGWLLSKILGDDLEVEEQGKPKIAQGTVPDRIISTTDTEMRHGRKSASQRFDGFKVSVATEPENELILDISDMQAPGSDGQQLMPTIERVEQHAGVEVERVIVDGAYNSGDNLAACSEYRGRGVDIVTRFRRPKDPEVAKSAFAIDLEDQTISCPQGHSVTGKPGRDRKGRDILKFTFERPVCASCPLFEACVRSKTSGRTVRTHAHEELLQKTRARQSTTEYKEMYCTRSKVERKIGEVVRHGIRDTRYLGGKKRQLQRLWTGAAVNLKRLFTLAQDKKCDLATILAMPEQIGQAMIPA
jgi:transposase